MRLKLVSGAFLSLALAAAPAHASVNLITNGDFETGTYAGWSVNVEPGSAGALFIQPNDGGVTSLSGLSYSKNPNGGAFFSITDQDGPGSYSLTQVFTIGSSSGPVSYSFDTFANSNADVFANGRDFMTIPNQNAVVDIILGSADPFTSSASDIVATLYGPGADSSDNPNPWTSYSGTLDLAPGTYQIRFAEADNQSNFQQGVDNVAISISSGVPEPSTWVMMLLGFVALAFSVHKRGMSVLPTVA